MLKFNYRKGLKSKRKSKPRKPKHGLIRKKQEAMKRHKAMVKFQSKNRPTANWRGKMSERDGIQPWRGPRFKKDLSIRVLSLGRGPILGKRSGKSRLQIRFTNCITENNRLLHVL